MNHRQAFAALTTAALAFGSAACSSGGPPKAPASPSPSLNVIQQGMAVGKRFAQCGRDHGHPAFPDPIVEDGRVRFPVPGEGAAVKNQIKTVEDIPECHKILTEMPSLLNIRPRNPPAAADMVKARKYSDCIRHHGIPEWPDPKADGSFPVSGTSLEEKSPRVRAARDACEQYAVDFPFS
ncbi:hypothetical protein [Microbispora sp. NPDC049125]|uniref:hypothetical protein n=1 Tax=Microbispora sp. NPDC049125 TaxID=3154929 RepID=UPI003467A544